MPVWPFSASRASKDADLLLRRRSRLRAAIRPYSAKAARPTRWMGDLSSSPCMRPWRLSDCGRSPEAEPLAQAFVDALFKQLDSGLREEGVGDLAVPKRMHKLAGVFYARLEAYSGALDAHNSEALRETLGAQPSGGRAAHSPKSWPPASVISQRRRRPCRGGISDRQKLGLLSVA